MSDTPTTTHTIDDALDRFTLIGGSTGDPNKNTACVMTALSWVAGESWTDHPKCAHPILANLAIRANDHPDTTADQRAAIVRAGATGLIGTWWLPGEVVAACIAQAMLEFESVVERCLATLSWVSVWKESGRPRPNLSGADLRGADLRGANLRGADLSGANLRGADLSAANLSAANLRGADLSAANLRGANLSGADLRGANLRYTDLSGANLRYTDLSGADLRGADLSGANLRGADLSAANLRGANLRYTDISGADLRGAYGAASAPCNKFTVPPTGWTINTATWRLEQVPAPQKAGE